MQTIIANPKNKTEEKAILDFLKKIKVKADLYKEPTKADILKGLEKSVKQAKAHVNGKAKLKPIESLLNEL